MITPQVKDAMIQVMNRLDQQKVNSPRVVQLAIHFMTATDSEDMNDYIKAVFERAEKMDATDEEFISAFMYAMIAEEDAHGNVKLEIE